MSWYAVDNIEKAVEDTKEILLPFDLGTWLRLMLIVLFVGGGGGIPTSGFNTGGFEPETGNSTEFQDFEGLESANPDAAITSLATGAPRTALIAVAGLLVAGLIGLLFYISSVFEFIYYQVLMDEDVRIRRNFRKHTRNGLRYFGFRIGVLLATLALIGLGVGAVALANILIIPALLLFIPFIIAVSVFNGLITDFVLPHMIESGKGVIASWRSVYPDLKAEWKELGVYLIARLVLNMTGAAISFAVLLTAGLTLGIPLIIIGVLLYQVAAAAVLLPVLAGIVLLIVLILGVSMPIRTYMKFYALRNYHDITA